jgi:hypothetical protein
LNASEREADGPFGREELDAYVPRYDFFGDVHDLGPVDRDRQITGDALAREGAARRTT